MAVLDIQIDDELVTEVARLAVRYCRSDSEAS